MSVYCLSGSSLALDKLLHTLWTHPVPSFICTLAYLFSSTWSVFPVQFFTEGYKQRTQMQPCPWILPVLFFTMYLHIWLQDNPPFQLKVNLFFQNPMASVSTSFVLHPMLHHIIIIWGHSLFLIFSGPNAKGLYLFILVSWVLQSKIETNVCVWINEYMKSNHR